MEERIAQFRAVTNSSLETAIETLDACGGDLETAVECFLQQSEANDVCANESSSSSAGEGAGASSDVRAPIAATSGVLVEESFHRSYAPTRRPRQASSVFSKFRDFEAETKAREASLFGSTSNGAPAVSDGKRKTLETLFRPPLEIMHRGDFETAKLSAVDAGRWLMVNVQKTDEFSCQVLNRDVWNNGGVQELVRSYFVLWQIYSDTADGQRFQAYYPVSSYPFVCIIDPRTGELLSTVTTNDVVALCDAVAEFVDRNPSIQGRYSTATIPKNHCQSANGRKRGWEDNAEPTREPASKVFRAEEEDSSSGVSTASSIAGSTSKAARVDAGERISEDQLAPLGEADVRLLFRLPDGGKRYLRAPNNATVQAILSHVEEHWRLSPSGHEFLMNFPTRRLNQEDPGRTLEELGVQRQDVIYVEEQ